MNEVPSPRGAGLVVLVPTRLRPHAVAPLAEAFAATCTAGTWLVWCVDGCPQEAAYRQAHRDTLATYGRQQMVAGPRRRLVGTLNHHACRLSGSATPPYALGFMGDDHRPETVGWDTAYLSALRELGSGIVYGDDGIQGGYLPTQVAVTADIIRAVGYLAPPALAHMFCDEYWRDLGNGAGCLTYLPEVRVAHHHPAVGLGAWDASYAESSAEPAYMADHAAYLRFAETGLADDVAKVRHLRMRAAA